MGRSKGLVMTAFGGPVRARARLRVRRMAQAVPGQVCDYFLRVFFAVAGVMPLTLVCDRAAGLVTLREPAAGTTVDSSPVDHLIRRSEPLTPVTTPWRTWPPNFGETT
jgi:hypothetical protein